MTQLKMPSGWKKENNDSAGPLLLDGTYFGFISLRSWRCWGERGRLIRAWPELPSWKAPLWLTPLSSLSSPLQLARWQVHVEKRDNQLPSPRLPLSSPHLPCVFITLCPHHFLSITLNLLAFLPLFLSPFIPHVDSHCLLIRYPLLSLIAASQQLGWQRERKREHVIRAAMLHPAFHSDTLCKNHCQTQDR